MPLATVTQRRLAGAAALLAGAVFIAGALLGSAASGAAALAATPTPTPAAQGVTVTWGGDVTLGSSYGMPPAQGWPQLAPVAPILQAADLATVNYEGTFGPGGASKCGAGSADCFAFQAPPANARTLRRAGIDVVNQANNHAWDYGALGWHSTRAALAAASVLSTGAPGQLTLIERNGIQIGLVGFSTYPWSASMTDDAGIKALIGMAKAKAAIVIVFMHAGAEGAAKDHVPHGTEHAFGENRGDSRHFAHTAIDAGADLVLGSGPHVLRGMELYKGRLVAYSLGNLAGWKNFNTAGLSGLSGLLTVILAPDGRFFAGKLSALALDHTGVPHADPAGRATRLVRTLTTSDFGGGGLRIGADGTITVAKRR